jgi:hypothetical protein
MLLVIVYIQAMEERLLFGEGLGDFIHIFITEHDFLYSQQCTLCVTCIFLVRKMQFSANVKEIAGTFVPLVSCFLAIREDYCFL